MPCADVRLLRTLLVVHNPFEDTPGMEDVIRWRGVAINDGNESSDDLWGDLKDGRPLTPKSPERIPAYDSTLFVTIGWDDKNCEDEDYEDRAARRKRLEFQEHQEEKWQKRQDTSRVVIWNSSSCGAKTEILQDPDTGDSLQYAFVEFGTEARRMKMDNAHVNDQRIKVDFSQSVAKMRRTSFVSRVAWLKKLVCC
ncbi:hypothetical protein ACHAWF_001700 [Thalassiosira exigua]